MNPTVTRVVAPATKLPELVRLGNTEELLVVPFEGLRTRAKWGEVAIMVRKCVRLVIYNATPGTFLRFRHSISEV